MAPATQELTHDTPHAAKSWRMKHSSEMDCASWDAFAYFLKWRRRGTRTRPKEAGPVATPDPSRSTPACGNTPGSAASPCIPQCLSSSLRERRAKWKPFRQLKVIVRTAMRTIPSGWSKKRSHSSKSGNGCSGSR